MGETTFRAGDNQFLMACVRDGETVAHVSLMLPDGETMTHEAFRSLVRSRVEDLLSNI